MNKIFKVVWSKVRNAYVVVSEIAKNTVSGVGKRNRVKRFSLGATLAAVALTSSFFASNCAEAAIDIAEQKNYIAYKAYPTENEINSLHDGLTVRKSDNSSYVLVEVDGSNGVKQYFWVQDGYTIYTEPANPIYNDYSDTKAIITRITGEAVSSNFDAISTIQVHDNQTNVMTVIGDHLENVTLNPFGAASNSAKVEVHSSYTFVLNEGTEEQVVIKTNGEEQGDIVPVNFNDYFKTVGSDKANGLYYDEKTKSYTYKGHHVHNNSVYYIDMNGEDVAGGYTAGVFVIDDKVYDGTVKGGNGETLLTGQIFKTVTSNGVVTETSSLVTYWGSEIENYNMTIAESKMTLGNLKEAFDVLVDNDRELSKADVKSVKISNLSNGNSGTIDLVYNKTVNGVDQKVPGTISVTKGTNVTGDNTIVFSNTVDGVTNSFAIDTGSSVVANDGDQYSGETSLNTISINGNKYTVGVNNLIVERIDKNAVQNGQWKITDTNNNNAVYENTVLSDKFVDPSEFGYTYRIYDTALNIVTLEDIASANKLKEVAGKVDAGWILKVGNEDSGYNVKPNDNNSTNNTINNTVTLKSNDANLIVSRSGSDVTFDFSDTPNFTSISVGSGDKVFISDTGINMNSRKITGLANGTESGDAVHYGQLPEVVDGDPNDNVIVDSATSNGKKTYTIKGTDTYTTGVNVKGFANTNSADVEFKHNNGENKYKVSFVGGDNVTITSNDDTKSITVSADDYSLVESKVVIPGTTNKTGYVVGEDGTVDLKVQNGSDASSARIVTIGGIATKDDLDSVVGRVNAGWVAQVNGSIVKTVTPDDKTLNFVAGDNVTLDGTDGNIKITATDTYTTSGVYNNQNKTIDFVYNGSNATAYSVDVSGLVTTVVGTRTTVGGVDCLSKITINDEEFYVPVVVPNANVGTNDPNAPVLESINLNGVVYRVASFIEGEGHDYQLTGEINSTDSTNTPKGEQRGHYQLDESGSLRLNMLEKLTGNVEVGKIVVDGIASRDYVDGVIATEKAAREATDNQLQANIDAEAQARAEADNQLQANIDAEAQARQAADNQLQANIDANAANIASNASDIEANKQAIKAEVAARQETDVALSDAIDNVVDDLAETKAQVEDNEVAIEENAQAIANETAERQATDNKLQASIDKESVNRQIADAKEAVVRAEADATEKAAREAADNQLQANIDAEAAARAEADNQLQANIDAEARIRGEADNQLQANIDAEAQARTEADNQLQANIDAEAQARAEADNQLQANIDANAANIASNASDIEANKQAIKAEVVARQEADVALSDAIDNVVDDLAETKAQVEDNEVAIEENAQAIANETAERQATDNKLQANIDKESVNRQIADAKEAVVRAEADATEKAAREAADNQLQANIDAEVQARQAADASLSNRIDKETAERVANDIHSGAINSVDGTITLTKNNGEHITLNGAICDSSLDNVSYDAASGNMTFVVKDHYNNDQDKSIVVGDIASKTVLEAEIIDRIKVDQALIEETKGLRSSINKLGSKVNKVGAGAAALAALHPMDFDPDDKLSFAVGAGNYAGENATALGAFYRPNEKVMMSVAGTYGNGENMVNMGVSFALDKTNNVSNSRTAMAREIVDLREQVATQGQQIAQLIALVNQLAGTPAAKNPAEVLFPDIPENHWAYEYIYSLAAKGIVEGYPDGNFGGDRTMTRYEFATMLFKAMQNGVVLSEQIRQEFEKELGRIRVDRVKGADDDANKIERVRVNADVDRDDYGSKVVQVKH